MECVCFEINLRGNKWVIFSIYRPPSQSEAYFFENLGIAIDRYSEKSENFLLLGDVNKEETDEQLHNFMIGCALKNMMKEPTCFKSENPRLIDLILTNRYRSFQNTTTVETGLSDFHKMVLTVLKTTYQKAGPTVVNYRDCKKFFELTFKQDLRAELEIIESSDLNFVSFQNCF